MKVFADTTRKTVFAFIVGPLALIPAMLVASFLYLITKGNFNNLGGDISAGVVTGLFGLAIAYPATLLLGIPSSLILSHFGKFKIFPLLIISVIGAGVISLWVMPSLLGLLLFSYSGAAVCLGCWYVYSKY